jgi:hypothetical protein
MSIYEHRAFINMSEDQIYSSISAEGGIPRRVKEEPGSVFDSHRNPTDLVLAFLRGSAEIRVGEHVYHCVPGDKLNIPGSAPHSAVVGTQGVVYLLAECVTCTD